MLHLTNDYHETVCHIPLNEVPNDEWTDAIEEVLEYPPTDTCDYCLVKAERIAWGREQDDARIREEMAREEGMLHGIDAYNDMMGY